MTLLDVIFKAVSNHDGIDSKSDYPFPLSHNSIFSSLKTNTENPNPGTLITPISGSEISENDTQIIDLGKNFSTNLKRKLKDTNNFDKNEFLKMLNQFLEKIGQKKTAVSEELSVTNIELLMGKDVAGLVSGDSIKKMVEKSGLLMGREVSGLVLRGAVRLEMWELVETLITNSLLDQSSWSFLVNGLIENERSDLLCVVIKQASDLGASEILSILKYFLCPSKEAVSNMVSVREDWGSEALLAIEKVDVDASILLMVAHDGFTSSELCLHYLLASKNIDEVMFASAVSKLSGNEMSGFILYLLKWLKKYEKFPQAGPCPKAGTKLGLKLCDWVPKLEDVTKCLGIVIDENYSSLVLNSDLHEELKCIERVVGGLASEAKLCCFVGNVAESLKVGAAQS